MAVMVRVRPPGPCKQEQAMHCILHVVDQHVLIFDPEEHGGPPSSMLPTHRPKQQGKDLKFVFDRVFGEGATQEEVFEHTTCEMLDSIFDGYNCSGKTQQTTSILAGAPAPSAPGLSGLSGAMDLFWKPPGSWGDGGDTTAMQKHVASNLLVATSWGDCKCDQDRDYPDVEMSSILVGKRGEAKHAVLLYVE